MKRFVFSLATAVLAGSAAPALAQTASPAGAPQATAGALPAYVPPLRGAPSRRVGGSSRGTEQTLPQIAVVAPDHVGLTTQEQPVLYWFISKPTNVRLEITLIDDEAVKPMLELPLMQVSGPAIYPLDLAKHGVRLKYDTEYQWTVALVPDAGERSGDVISSGVIKRTQAPAPLKAALEQSGDVAGQVRAYAGAGIWYDAIHVLSQQIAREPQNVQLRQQRAALASQVGLSDIAAYDRGK